MCTKEWFEKLEELKSGKRSVSDFSDEEWEEYLRVHRMFMESLTVWFVEAIESEAEEYSGSAEEAVDG